MTLREELANIEKAIETIDPGAKATIENAIANIKVHVAAIAESVEQHAAAVKAAVATDKI